MSELGSRRSTWVVRPRVSARPALQLLCFPYAGAGASIYRTWPAALPPGVDVLAVQLPGRESRILEQAHTSASSLVQSMLDPLAEVLVPPFAFFGHSMGALVAFELARALRRAGRPGPARLLVSGRPAPQLRNPRPPRHRLPDPELVAELRDMAGTQEAVLEHPELMELLLPILRADLSVCDTYAYVPEPPLRCPIVAFGGREDPEATEAELAGWRAQTVGEFHLHLLPGDHFYFRLQGTDFFARLAAALRPLLGPW